MSSKFEFMTVDDLRQVIEKMGGPEGAQKFLKGGSVLHWWFPELEVHAQVTLGLEPKTNFQIRKKLKDDGIRLTNDADELLSSPNFTVAPIKATVEVIIVTPRQLGFVEILDSSYCSLVYQRAKNYGLDPCPIEVGPKLFFALSPGEEFIIASDTSGHKTFRLIGKTDNSPATLDIEYLTSPYGGTKELNRDMKLVFVRSPRLVYKLALVEKE